MVHGADELLTTSEAQINGYLAGPLFDWRHVMQFWLWISGQVVLVGSSAERPRQCPTTSLGLQKPLKVGGDAIVARCLLHGSRSIERGECCAQSSTEADARGGYRDPKHWTHSGLLVVLVRPRSGGLSVLCGIRPWRWFEATIPY